MKFSVIIPVLHEEELIGDCLSRLTAGASDEEVEIIIVDGDPDGSTINRISDQRVRTLLSPKGRANQMNAGAAAASGEILVFLHVDSELPENAFPLMEQTLRSYPAGAFDIQFVGPRFIYKILSRTVSWRARRKRIPYGDQTYFMTKAYFETLGGFSTIPIMEDVDLMLRIKRRGDRIGFIRERVKTSARRWEAEGVLFTMLRNPILSFLFYRGVPAEKLARYYKSGRPVYRRGYYD